MLTIARHAFLESIRQPVFAVLILVGMLAMVLNVNLAAFTFDDDNKILVDMGLSTLLLSGLVLAASTATTVLTREIESRTVLTVVSKPLPRPALVVGKYMGVAAALMVGLWSLAAVFLLTLRHRVPSSDNGLTGNDAPVIVFGVLAVVGAVSVAGGANYLRGRPFGSSFTVLQAVSATAAVVIVSCIDKDWKLQNPLTDFDPQVMIAVALIFEAALVLAAVAIAASTRLGSVMTLMACAVVLLAGLTSEYFLGSLVVGGTAASGWTRWLAWPFYVSIPNMQFFWTADALTQGNPISLAHLGLVTLYAGSIITGLLSLAVALFQSRDVG